MLTEVWLYGVTLDYHVYFSPRVAAASSSNSEKVAYMKYHTY